MRIPKLEWHVFVTVAMVFATAGCSSDDASVLVSPGDGFVRLLAADSDSFYFTRRDDAGGVLYRGNPTGAPHTVLARGIGGWLSGEGVVHDGYLYYSDEDALFRIPVTGGDLEPVAQGLAGVTGLAAAGGTVYIQHVDGLSALDVESGDLTALDSNSYVFSSGPTVFDGHLVWSNGVSLAAKDLAAPADTAVLHDRSTDCPDEEECSFQKLDIVGSTDRGILFVENTFSRYDTGEHWSNGDPKWAVRADSGALYELAFAADGEVSVEMIEDDVVLAAGREGALWGVRRDGQVVGLDPAQSSARTIDVDDDLLFDGELYPRLLATRTHLIFPSTEGSIHGVELP